MAETGTTLVNYLWLLAIVGGPILLALVMGYAILRRRRNRLRSAMTDPRIRQSPAPMNTGRGLCSLCA